MSQANLLKNHSEKQRSFVSKVMDFVFAFILVMLFTCNPNHVRAQSKKDSIPTPVDTLVAQYKYSMTTNIMAYFQQNFKSLTIKDFEEFQKWIDDIMGKYLASFVLDYDKKKLLKK